MSSRTPLQSWALPRLQPLLPPGLPEDDLLQAISYAATLSSADQVSAHFKDFLGESSDSLSFISDFNSRLFGASSKPTTPSYTPDISSSSDVPYRGKKPKKSKPGLHKFPRAPRQANEGVAGSHLAPPSGAYIKKDIEDEYYTGGSSGSRRPSPKPAEKSTPPPAPLDSKPAAEQTPKPSTASQQKRHKEPGILTSDLINVKSKKKPTTAKVSYTGGTAMRGTSAELNDLESALRALEMSTNRSLPTNSDPKKRKCNCGGLKHELLVAAPNCLSCGKIICIKEGLGPCTFCNAPLFTSDEIQSMVRTLRDEAGKEKQAINAAAHKRPEVSSTPRPFSKPAPEADESLRKATEHRDRLLGFQATSAKRTKIIDQAADFETPMSASGLNPWASPQERALQLKRQQKTMRLMDWHAKAAYEKRKVVVAIDLKGRKVMREMQNIEPPGGSDDVDSEDEDGMETEYDEGLARGGAGAVRSEGGSAGAFSRNPLLKGLIRPVFKTEKGKGKGKDKEEEKVGPVVDNGVELGRWRRVQDDLKDNEEVILDGGMGGRDVGDEPARG